MRRLADLVQVSEACRELQHDTHVALPLFEAVLPLIALYWLWKRQKERRSFFQPPSVPKPDPMYMRKYMSKSGKDALLPSSTPRSDSVSTHVPAVIPRVPALQFAVFVYTLVYVASIVSWVIAGGSRTDAEEMRAIPEGARALRSLALLAVVLELIHTRWPVEQPVAVAVRAVLFVVSLPFTVWALILPIAHVADIAVALVLLVVGASAKLVPWGELANRPRAAYSWSETGTYSSAAGALLLATALASLVECDSHGFAGVTFGSGHLGVVGVLFACGGNLLVILLADAAMETKITLAVAPRSASPAKPAGGPPAKDPAKGSGTLQVTKSRSKKSKIKRQRSSSVLGNTDVLLSGMAAAASQIRASISDAAEEAMKADEVDGGAAAEPTLVFSLRASSQRERSRSRSRSRREPRGSVTSEVSAAEASTAAAAADVEAPPPPLPAAPSTVAEAARRRRRRRRR